MAEQLQLGLSIDASGMTQAADKAAQQLQQKFTQAAGEIRKEFEKPATMQLELNVKGDPRKAYQDMVGGQREVLKNQKEIDRRRSLSAKLQGKVTQALKGTVKEKKAALKLIERLAKNTKLTAEEMDKLAKAAKELKRSLPKDSDMPKPSSSENLESGFLKANIAATALTRAVDMVASGIRNLVTTGMQMQSLNLQMEAFTGSAESAETAMANFAEIASRSPLNVMEVAKAGQIMMAFGVDTRDAAEATDMLAVAAAASGGDINLMSRNLGQIQAQQRAYTRDLTQFAIQGVPIWENLSEVTGESVASLKEMAKDGDIAMEEVMAAMRNMTKEGTAFREVADRMQETYAGALAKIESSFQMASGKIIESISDIDKAFGGITESIVKDIEKDLGRLERFFENIAIIAERLKYDIDKTFEGSGIGRWLADTTNKLNDLFGGSVALGSLGISLKVTEESASALADAFGRGEFAAMDAQANKMSMSADELRTKLDALARSSEGVDFANKFKEGAMEAQGLTTEAEGLIREIMELNNIDDVRILDEIAGQNAALEEARQKVLDIGEAYKKQASEAKAAYEKQKGFDEQFIASKEQVIAQLDEQIAKTRELGPAGRELERIRRKELEHMAKTGKELKGHVSEEKKKKLQAQASLERMNGQAAAAELQKQKLQAQQEILKMRETMETRQAEHQEKMLKLEQEKTTKIEQQNVVIGNLTEAIDGLNRTLQGDLVGGWDQLKVLIGNAEAKTNDTSRATVGYNNTINETIGQLSRVNGQLDLMRQKILTMPKLPTTAPNAFSGGPVSGGDKRTVNELGKEAFLSASGKLSMINAPAWGEWKAPSSGTIIPAHLTKQLNIPTGGINLNKTAGSKASVGGAMSVIQAAGGDTFHQNVTVQAANPTQAANNLMVEMTRLRRRRFR